MTKASDYRGGKKWEPMDWFEEDISPSHYMLIRKGDEYKAVKEWDRAQKCYEEALEESRKRYHRLDPAMECCALVRLADLFRLQSRFDEALSYYDEVALLFHRLGHRHNEGVAYRFMGMIRQLCGHWKEALHQYNEALGCFTRLEEEQRHLGNWVRAAQYAAWIQDIRVCIEEVEHSYSPRVMVHRPPPVYEQAPPGKEGVWLQLIPILESIEAGRGTPTIDQITGYASVSSSTLDIDGDSYEAINLKDGGPVNLYLHGNRYGNRYFIVRAVGDSMNKAGIEDGDYVILEKTPTRRPIEDFNGSIVAAVLREAPEAEEGRGTLKRYYQKGDSVRLRPESDNPEHKERVFRAKELEIVGIAIAVLKRRPS